MKRIVGISSSIISYPGEVTGSGLSLGYDIVVKVHGGNIDVNSIAGEGAEFVIRSPYQAG